MKSGTTWWWSILTSHPDIVSSRAQPSATGIPDGPQDLNEQIYRAKEIHFFDHYGGVEDIDPASYHRYFPRPPGFISGEWTPRYMYDFWTPPMLRAVAPETKLLVLFRDPLDRFVSALAHHREWDAELTAPVMDHQFRRGLYWQQMQTLMNYFERDQILVLQYEQCVNNTVREAERTFLFLGVDPDRWRSPQECTQHVGPMYSKPIVNQATREALRQAIEPDIRRLLEEFPEIDGALWPSINQE